MKNLLFVIFALAFLFVGCKKDEPIITQDGFVETTIPTTDEILYPLNGMIVNETESVEGNITCIEYEEAISATNTEFLPNNFDDKFGGQIFRSGEDIEVSAWNPLLGGVRDGLFFTVVGPTVEQASFFMEKPSLHEFNDHLNSYKQQEVLMDADAQFSYRIIEVKSIEQLKFDLDAHLKVGKWVDISGAINNSEIEENNYFVVEMIQKHASINISLPSTPEELYEVSPNAEQVGTWSPVILSGINYGRAAYFILKSSYSKSEARSAISGGFKFWGKVELDVNISQEHQEIINSMEINAVIYGGAQQEGLSTINGVESIKDYIESGFIDNNAFGVPLGYKFKYIKDFSDAKVVSNLVYSYRDCVTETVEEPDEEPRTVTPFSGNRVDFCPVHENGTQGDGIGLAKVDFESRLEIRNGNELWGITNLRIEEIGDNNTTGVVDDETRLYTAPSGQHIKTINSNPVTYFSYTDTDDAPEISGTDFNLDGDFIQKVEMVAVAGSESLPCTGYQSHLYGDERCYLALWYKDIEITIGYD